LAVDGVSSWMLYHPWILIGLFWVLFGIQKHLQSRARNTVREECGEKDARLFFTLTHNLVALFVAFLFLLALRGWGMISDTSRLGYAWPWFLAWAFVNGVSISFAIDSRMAARKVLQSHYVEPLYRSSVIVNVLWGALVLCDKVSPWGWVGIGAFLLSAFLVVTAVRGKKTGEELKNLRRGIALSILGAVLAAVASIALKECTTQSDAVTTLQRASLFLVLAYAFGLFSFLLRSLLGGWARLSALGKYRADVLNSVKWGAVSGLVFYFAGMALIASLASVNYTIVMAAFSTHSLLSIWLDARLLKETAGLRDRRIWLALALVVAGYVCIKYHPKTQETANVQEKSWLCRMHCEVVEKVRR